MTRFHGARSLWLGLAASVALFGAQPVLAADNPQVANEIMALARAQWAAEIAGRPAAEQLSSVADDYTEFNPDYPTRLEGRAMAMGLAGIQPDARAVYSDMQNPRVQVYRDTAILTYNFVGITRDGQGHVRPASASPLAFTCAWLVTGCWSTPTLRRW